MLNDRGFVAIVALALTSFVSAVCFAIFGETTKVTLYSRYVEGDTAVQHLLVGGFADVVDDIFQDPRNNQYADLEFYLKDRSQVEFRFRAHWLQESGKLNVNWITHEQDSNSLSKSAAMLLANLGVPHEDIGKFMRYLNSNMGREFTSIIQPITSSGLSLDHFEVIADHFAALPANSSLDLNVSPASVQLAVVGRTLRAETNDTLPRGSILNNETLLELVRDAHRDGKLDRTLARRLGIPGRIEVLCLTPLFPTTYDHICQPIYLPR